MTDHAKLWTAVWLAAATALQLIEGQVSLETEPEDSVLGRRDIRISNLLSTARGFGKRGNIDAWVGIDPTSKEQYGQYYLTPPQQDVRGGYQKRAEMSDFLSTARGFGKRKMSTLLSTARGFGKRSSDDLGGISGFISTARGYGKRKMSTLLSTARGYGKRSAEVAPQPPPPARVNQPHAWVLEPSEQPPKYEFAITPGILGRLRRIQQLSPREVDQFLTVIRKLLSQESNSEDTFTNQESQQPFEDGAL